jgi:hypothetical protein
MSNSPTKKIFIFASLTLLAVGGIFIFLLYQIDKNGTRLEEQLILITERDQRETSFIRIRRMVQETEAERKIIDSAFFKDESDSIVFLGEIEKIATSIGIELSTESLDKVTEKDKNIEQIRMTFVYLGRKESALKFIKILETSPYHSWIDSLTLTSRENNLWEGKLTFLITLQPS